MGARCGFEGRVQCLCPHCVPATLRKNSFGLAASYPEESITHILCATAIQDVMSRVSVRQNVAQEWGSLKEALFARGVCHSLKAWPRPVVAGCVHTWTHFCGWTKALASATAGLILTPGIQIDPHLCRLLLKGAWNPESLAPKGSNLSTVGERRRGWRTDPDHPEGQLHCLPLTKASSCRWLSPVPGRCCLLSLRSDLWPPTVVWFNSLWQARRILFLIRSFHVWI